MFFFPLTRLAQKGLNQAEVYLEERFEHNLSKKIEMMKNKLFLCKFNYMEQILSLGNYYNQQKYIWPVHLFIKY